MKGVHMFTPACVTVAQELLVHPMKFEDENALLVLKGELSQ